MSSDVIKALQSDLEKANCHTQAAHQSLLKMTNECLQLQADIIYIQSKSNQALAEKMKEIAELKGAKEKKLSPANRVGKKDKTVDAPV